jgi:hypothetical protein
MSEKQAPYDVIADCERMRNEAAARVMTIPEAINEGQWLRRTPDGILAPDVAKKTIEALLSALEASPCYFKGARLGIPVFTLLAYDRAGHVALRAWADAAEDHGCREGKVDEARRRAKEWSERPDCKWPD